MRFAITLRPGALAAADGGRPDGRGFLTVLGAFTAVLSDRDYARARFAAWWNGDDPPPRPVTSNPTAAGPHPRRNWLTLTGPLAAPLARAWANQEPLRRRVHAWWIGEYLPEDEPPPEREIEPLPEPEPVRVPEPPPAEYIEPPVAARSHDRWSPERARVVQWLWGDGYDFPGGAEFILELVRPLRLGGDYSILDIGCGIGSSTRAIASMFGSSVIGFEASPALVAEAAAALERAELADRVQVLPIDLTKPLLPDRRFDAILCRMVFGAVADYQTLLAEIDRHLKPGGQLLFTEQVLNQANAATLALDAWQSVENQTTYPVTLDTIEADLAERGYDVRIAEDMSPAVRALVVGAWEKVAHELEDGLFSADEIDLLNREMELWHHRVGVYDSGVLKFVRVHAIKRGREA